MLGCDYVLGCDSNCSDEEGKYVYTAEFVWPSNDKPCVCGSLKPTHKDRQESFTFDVSKYERIFDELYKNGYIKMSHVIPPLEELKRRVYCKFHNTFSHATNDCNVLRRQIQSAVNEGRIIVPQMKVDQNPFPAHTHVLELSNPNILIRPNQAESTKRKNIIIGEERSEPSKSHQETPAKKVSEDSLKNSARGGARTEEECQI